LGCFKIRTLFDQHADLYFAGGAFAKSPVETGSGGQGGFPSVCGFVFNYLRLVILLPSFGWLLMHLILEDFDLSRFLLISWLHKFRSLFCSVFAWVFVLCVSL
jgi:hypothetical protein